MKSGSSENDSRPRFPPIPPRNTGPGAYDQAYAWENLYYCCEHCQSNIREPWDDALLRPDSPDYSFDMYFLFDYTTGEIRRNSLASSEQQRRADVSIRLYGLDLEEKRRHRRLELRKWQRSQERDLDDWAYRDYLEIAEPVHNNRSHGTVPR